MPPAPMPSLLSPLADAGAWALSALWLPIAIWTAVALTAEAVLRLRSGLHPLVPLAARRAVLWALPASIAAALVFPMWLPAVAVERMVAAVPASLTLPPLIVGGGNLAAAPEATGGMPLVPLAAGAVLLVVALVATVRLGLLGSALVRLRQLTAGTVFCADVQREATAIARGEGLRRPIRAVTTALPTVPFTFGWRRPVVVVPQALTNDTPQLRLVLAHEIAHVSRGDFASGVMERAAVALFGWHPLVSVLARGIDLDRERAVDAAVLAQRPAERRDYAAMLLSFSRLPSPALALGAARGSHALTSRITTMNTTPLSPDRLRRLGATTRLAALTLFLGMVGATGLTAVSPAHADTLFHTVVTDRDVSTPEPLAISEDAAAPAIAVAEAEDAVLPSTESEAAASDEPAVASEAAAARVIRGTVTDASTGQPLIGASVSVVGTRTGAATDLQGDFVINGVDAGDVELRITYVGYTPLTVVPQVDEPVRVGLVPQGESRSEIGGGEVVERMQRRNPSGAPHPEVYVVVEQPPSMIGGLDALRESVVYPPEAKAAGVEGTVFVQFVVDENGGVQNAETVRCPDERLCEAALTAVRGARFQPGRQRGEPVKAKFTVPIDFRLPADSE